MTREIAKKLLPIIQAFADGTPFGSELPTNI